MPEHVKPRYVVLVDDNFHHMDEGETYKLGEFDDCRAAVDACKKMVDSFLLEVFKPGMTADELWKIYSAFGEDPFIAGPDGPGEPCRFSGWDYARQRCTMSELADLAAIDRTTLTRTVDRMQDAGWLARLSDGEDMRVTRLALTAPGEKLFVYNAPVFPTQQTPPGQNGYSQAAILQYYRTSYPSGDETPLSGTCYPVAWGFDYNQELPLETQRAWEEEVARECQPHRTGGKVLLGGVTWLIVARRPLRLDTHA